MTLNTRKNFVFELIYCKIPEEKMESPELAHLIFLQDRLNLEK